MKKQLMKRIVAMLCAGVFFVAIQMPASALENPVPVAVKWYYPESIISLDKNSDSLVMHLLVNGKEQKLTLVFPSFGGFRLYGEQQGFFSPSSLDNISYSENEKEKLSMRAKDGTRVELDTAQKLWKISVYNNMDNTVAIFAANQIWFGYQGTELKKVKLECGISSGEVLYGLGERFGSFNQIGIKTLLWNQDAWSDNDTSYKNIPILHSSVGYMLYFNSTYSAVADIGVTDKAKYSLDFSGPKFDMYLWTGSPIENIGSYTALTGTPLLPPKWAFRYWSGASGQTWEADGVENAVAKLTESLNGYKKLGITDIAALYGEGELSYNIMSYNKLLPTNTRMLAWTTPFQSRADMSYWIPSLSTLFSDYELPAFRDALNPWTYCITDTMDYSHPNALAVQRERWKKYLDWGLKGLMVDYGEYIPQNALAYNGMTGAEFHNFSSYYYSKVNNEMFQEKYGDDFVIFARNATPGSQVWATNFSGDQKGTFEGMKKAVNALLTISASGFSSWGSDIGGYGATESPDVYMRWMQLGAFSPLMRLHGQGPQDPWNFGDAATEVFTSHYWLRENLLDKIYSCAITANKTGKPIAQSMAVAYPGNNSLTDNNDQYLFCDDFLVCPVTEDTYYRNVTLPTGNWFDLWSGRLYKGGNEYTVDAPQNRTPVFLRSGAVIPATVSSDTLNLTDKISPDHATKALVVTPPNGSRTTEFMSDKDTKTVYTSAAKDNTFTVSADRTSSEKVVLVYGINASEVMADGVKLKKLDHMPLSASETGYYVDSYKRTVIRMPESGWSNVSVTVGPLLSQNLAAGKKITTHSFRSGSTNPESILDGKIDTYWTISQLADAYFTVDLGATRVIDRVELKWVKNAGYSKNYKVSVSTDGENWKTAATVGNGDGMIDTLSFDPTYARYIKISDFAASFGSTCSLYEFGVFGSSGSVKPTDENTVDMSAVDDETEPDTKKTIIKKKVKVIKKGNNADDIYYEYIETWVVVVAVAAGVIVVGGAVVLIIFLKRRKKKIRIKTDETDSLKNSEEDNT